MRHPAKQFDELWIGDSIYLHSRNSFGKWEGWDRRLHTAYIRIGDSIYTENISEIEIRERPAKTTIQETESVTLPDSVPFDPSDREIDLHIEKLNPTLTHARAERILEYQIEICRKFISNAIAQKCPFVTIIHGKGEGVLKLEVEHLLSEFPEVNFHIPANKGGASEVWMSYK